MRRPIRFSVHTIMPDGTLWLDDGEGEESSVVSVKTYDSMGHGCSGHTRLQVIIMQLGRVQVPPPPTQADADLDSIDTRSNVSYRR